MASVDNLALFIGVNDYSAFDASIGNSPGTSDLLGSRNDAIVFWRVCRLMGFSPANMRVLTSPRLSAAEIATLEGASAENVGDATERGILDGASWLAGEIGARGQQRAGFLTFSGHGDFALDKSFVLCPSDVAGEDLQKAISFSALQAIFGAQGALSNLTVLLDCCNAGGVAVRGRARRTSLRGRPIPAAFAKAAPKIADKVLAACNVDQSAYQARFSGTLRGAFSWAVSAAIEQWKTREEAGGIFVTMSYAELIKRSQALLSALSFDQTPEFRGAANLAELPVFHKGNTAHGGEISSSPNAGPVAKQVTPEIKILLELSTLETTNVISVDNAIQHSSTRAVTYNAHTEYWNLPSSFLTALSGSTSLRSSGVTLTPNNDGTVTGFPVATSTDLEGMPSSAVWLATGTPTVPTSSICFYNSTDKIGVQFDLSSGALASLTWYRNVASGAPPSYALGTSAVLMSKVTSLPSGGSWFFMTLPPIKWDLDGRATAKRVGSATGGALAYNSGDSAWKAAVRDSSSNIQVYSSSTSTSWSSLASWSVTSPVAPAIASWSGSLYVAYASGGGSSNPIYVRVSTNNGTSWATAVNTSASTAYQPALAGLGSSIYLAYNDSGSILLRSSSNGSSWSSAINPSFSSPSAPALASFSSKLYLATLDGSGDVILRWSSNGSTWSSLTLSAVAQAVNAANTGATVSGLSLAAYGDFLLLTCNDSASQVWLCAIRDQGPLVSVTNLALQSPLTTSAAPALAGSGSALMLGTIASGYLNALGTFA